jgi:pilus assembly protein TadC
MAGVAGLVATWGWQLMIPDVGAIAWLAAPPVAVGVALVLGRVERPAVRVRRLRMIMDLPQILELLAAAMQAGLPLRTAVREVVDVCDGPLVEDLQGVLNSIDLGIPDAEAWRSLRDHPALGRVSIDLARSVDSGSMVVATLRRHARIARRDRRGAMEARARTVGVKSVPPLMICFVPAFLLICVVPIVVTAIRQVAG